MLATRVELSFVMWSYAEVRKGMGLNNASLSHGGQNRWICEEPLSRLMSTAIAAFLHHSTQFPNGNS